MTAKTLDEIMRRVLNDPDIFYTSYSIFDEVEWKNLGEEFRDGKPNEVTAIIDQKIQLHSQRKDRKENELRKAIKLTKALKSAINNKPHILKQMFFTLDRFGLIKCNLPNMEDYGKVVENHNRSTVEQYFLSKIDRAKGYQKRALKKILEYLKELYAMNLDILEIAFFVRKLNSLTQFMEVIKDE